MRGFYKDGMLRIDAGNRMDVDEIGEFVHFMLIFVTPSGVEVRRSLEDGNRSHILMDLCRPDAERLADKLQMDIEYA